MMKRERAYNSFDYWMQLIDHEAPMWEGGFLNSMLDIKALFVYTVIIDYDKGFMRNRWAHYPNLDALLGFIEYVFMPTATFTMFDEEEDNFMVPMAITEEILQYMESVYDKKGIQRDMNLTLDKLSQMKSDKELKLSTVKEFCQLFNKKWYEREGKVIYINVFKNSIEIADFLHKLVGAYGINLIEEELDMSYESWQELCHNLYDHEFLKQQFTSILNNKLGCLI